MLAETGAVGVPNKNGPIRTFIHKSLLSLPKFFVRAQKQSFSILRSPSSILFWLRLRRAVLL